MRRAPPPASEEELFGRARALEGASVAALARALGAPPPRRGLHAKGKVGTLLEAALGADAASAGVPDFTGLGIELKTVPVGERGAPVESTFVCSLSVAGADRAEWESSRARRKLSRVLFVPVLEPGSGGDEARLLGPPLLWSPTPAQERVLKDDFDEAMGLLGIGAFERLTARLGRWMQVRPKAATGRVRTLAFGPDGERLETVPRGFYLRARFTGALLRDPGTLEP